MRRTRDAVAEIDADGLVRRQKFTTWGIVALAVFVSVGMAEWSKRSAADEVIVDEKIFQQAIQIAAAAAVNVKVNENLGGELTAARNPKPATSRTENAGAKK